MNLENKSSDKKNVIGTYDVLMVLPLGSEWKTLSIGLNRGEPNYTPYEERPDIVRKQWDALKDFLIYLSQDRYLYTVGCFWNVPLGVDQFASKQKSNFWLGACKIAGRGQLHEVLKRNPTEWFDYVVTNSMLSSETSRRLIEVPEDKHFFEHILDCCENVYCVVEENDDRDLFDLACRRHDLGVILNKFKDALGGHGLVFSPTDKHVKI